jgi:hypothetical protein
MFELLLLTLIVMLITGLGFFGALVSVILIVTLTSGRIIHENTRTRTDDFNID